MVFQKVFSAVTGAALASGLLLLPAAGFSQNYQNAPPAVNQPQPGVQAQTQMRRHRMARRERHPEILRALKALNRAKMNLQRGAHDLGGHRADALRLVDQAIAQCRQALQYDKK